MKRKVIDFNGKKVVMIDSKEVQCHNCCFYSECLRPYSKEIITCMKVQVQHGFSFGSYFRDYFEELTDVPTALPTISPVKPSEPISQL